ncbi:MAG TPA: hypothetical protein VNO52_08570 [Methylomirabilota bacterium]|nr:hypothetical protein [Methylomirabilota bacterium]
MKSAYELAMERLNKTAPVVKLTAEQKKQIAEIDSLYKAKLAEREITLKGEIQSALARGDVEEARNAEQRLASERAKLAAECEEKKEQVRTAKS